MELKMNATYEKTIFGERRKFAEQLKAIHDVTAGKRCANTMPALDAKYRDVQTAVKNLLDDIAGLGQDKSNAKKMELYLNLYE
jgi:hypothetical protein